MIVSSSPALPPAQPARILEQVQSPANFSPRFVCPASAGPYADLSPSRAGDGPFGPFPQYYFPPLGCCSFYGGYGGYGGYYGAVPFWGEGPYVSRVPFAARQNIRGAQAVYPRSTVPAAS